MAPKRILSVGQCGADQYGIGTLLKTHFDADVVAADTQREVLDFLKGNPVDLVLVNRILDRDGSRGLDLITRLKTDEQYRDIPVMLVSNYADAQQQATERGALPGFGKSALDEPATLERLRQVLAV